MKKLLLILIFGIFFISFISANPSFFIKVETNYFFDGKEILVYKNDTVFDGIILNIIGINRDKTSRIVDMEITKISPELLGKFPNKTEMLISGQEKVLWSSSIIDVAEVNDIFLFVGVKGTNEVLNQTFYTEVQFKYDSGKVKFSGSTEMLKRIGERVFPGDWQMGLVLLAISLVLIYYVFFYKKGIFKFKFRSRK